MRSDCGSSAFHFSRSMQPKLMRHCAHAGCWLSEDIYTTCNTYWRAMVVLSIILCLVIPQQPSQKYPTFQTDCFAKRQSLYPHSAKQDPSASGRMAKLSYSQQVVVIIFGAMAAVIIGYSIWRLVCFKLEPRDDPSSKGQIPNKQKEYMAEVRDRNRQACIAEALSRL